MNTNETDYKLPKNELHDKPIGTGHFTEQDNPNSLYSISVSLKRIADSLAFIIEQAGKE